MSDNMPVLFNVFEDWNEESVVPHISFVSCVINYWLLNLIFAVVDSIRDLIRIRIVTPDSIRIQLERKRPIRRSLVYTSYCAIACTVLPLETPSHIYTHTLFNKLIHVHSAIANFHSCFFHVLQWPSCQLCLRFCWLSVHSHIENHCIVKCNDVSSCRGIVHCATVHCYCSQRILPLPTDSMFARSSSANRLSKSPQLPARNQMPRSTSNIPSSSSAHAVLAAFDPFSNTPYVFCFDHVLQLYCCPLVVDILDAVLRFNP